MKYPIFKFKDTCVLNFFCKYEIILGKKQTFSFLWLIKVFDFLVLKTIIFGFGENVGITETEVYFSLEVLAELILLRLM